LGITKLHRTWDSLSTRPGTDTLMDDILMYFSFIQRDERTTCMIFCTPSPSRTLTVCPTSETGIVSVLWRCERRSLFSRRSSAGFANDARNNTHTHTHSLTFDHLGKQTRLVDDRSVEECFHHARTHLHTHAYTDERTGRKHTTVPGRLKFSKIL